VIVNMSQQQQISKKRKFVADGVFYAELNEFLMRTLAEDGYAGVEVRVTPIRTEIIIKVFFCDCIALSFNSQWSNNRPLALVKCLETKANVFVN